MSNSKTGGKYADIISKARSTESGNTSLPEEEPKEPEEAVNLTIKVPKTLRRHWLIEAKRQDTSLTAAIVEALKARFGAPGSSSDEGAT